ncbi:MAG: carbamoyl-phosphate synthase large subunit [Rhodospirillales bacterium]|nr:carbamoyl-phosphate synthase large subunit [Rhodospirillales bacterium]
MPKRTDIHSILIIGAGPIVIGQACEFDYSGAQACKTLREEGYRVVLVNSNPATIMTDPEMAHATYIEPITWRTVARIIEKERPDALLPTMGGQTALNCALDLARNGVLEKFGVEMIGASREAIDKAEDREKFKLAMKRIGLACPRSSLAHSMEEALAVLAYNREEFVAICERGIEASPTQELLIEESLIGWKEFEMEVVRDKADNCIIVCSIENLDPMGVHTGDSITVAPAQTLTDKEYQILRDASIAVLREIGVDTGGSNVQFAVDPATGRMVVIEMNPRVSRSSALASKATGFPIAKVAARLAVGYTLDELLNDITGTTPASFEPTIDYVVTKMPRFAFEKFPGAEALLTTSMKSVGEAMSIGRTFQESLQKALRSMETGLTGLNEIEIKGAPDKAAIVGALARPTPDRILVIAQAFRHGLSVEEIAQASKYEPWFLRQIQELVETEAVIRTGGLPKDAKGLLDLKKKGFSDDRLAELTGQKAVDVATRRRSLGIRPVFKRIDTCAAEFESHTPYLYSCYEGDGVNPAECEAQPTDRRKVIILGGGPNRIGQGIEFDYCCVHAVYELREAGYETIMVNCNPETVSTDYDTADRLYFEPLTAEDVIELVEVERRNGELLGLIVQFGGQTPLKLAKPLEAVGIPILGTSPDAIDLAEDRDRFQKLIHELKLRQPDNGTATSQEQAIAVAEKIGYPVVIRPSYVLGGRAMQIVYDRVGLERYTREAVKVSGDTPVLIDSYLRDAIEVDVDALADKDQNVFVAGIMEHIEEAGIHSGDSACSLPPYSLPSKILAEIERQTEAMAKALKVVGLMNVQYAVKDGDVYVLEVNPRASRTVPFVAKATGQPIAKYAARLMVGEPLKALAIKKARGKHVAVKEAVFPFARFPGVDIILGPEMRSTGEVMGLDTNFGRAFAKSQLGAGSKVPVEGVVFVSVKDQDKAAMVKPVRRLIELGFTAVATGGTSDFLRKHGIETQRVNKVLEGRPHIVDLMKDGKVQLVFNTVDGASALTDSFTLRRTALMNKIAYYTTVAGAKASVEGIAALSAGALDVAPLQSYFKTTF